MDENPHTGEHFGRYRIVRRIGHGGMGVVYEAHDERLGRSVALKIVRPGLADADDYRARFEREASLLAKVRSQHIVKVHDYGSERDSAFLVTEFFKDGDLSAHLTQHGPLSRTAAVRLIAQVSEGIQDAHDAGVLHRDVKPSNVLLWKRGDALLPYMCDFGIATDGTGGHTVTGSLIGSLAYMAPERHDGLPATVAGDVYSIGCLLWACLTGKAPYSGTDFQVMSAHKSGPIPQLGTDDPLDRAIDAILTDALAKDPAQRIPTPRQLEQRLRAVLREHPESDATVIKVPAGEHTRAHAPEPAPPSVTDTETVLKAPPPADPAQPPASPDEAERRSRKPLIAALVGIAALAAILFVIMRPSGDDVEADVADAAATPSVSETPSAAPVDPPPAPPAMKLSSAPAYRAVTFQMQAPSGFRAEEGVEYTRQVQTDAGWETAAQRFTVPIGDQELGGAKACARVRLVADGEGGSTTGPATRLCDTSRPTTLDLPETPEGCPAYGSYSCHTYAIVVSGYRPGSTLTAKLTGSPNPCTARCTKKVEVDDDGRGRLQDGLSVYEATSATIRIGSQSATVSP